MVSRPVVQAGQQDLHIEHDLVFLQTPFPTQAFGVDLVAGCAAFCQFLMQLIAARSTACHLLQQTTSPPLETDGQVTQLPLSTMQTFLKAEDGSSFLLTAGEFGLLGFDFRPIVKASIQIYLGHNDVSSAVIGMNSQAILANPESRFEFTFFPVSFG